MGKEYTEIDDSIQRWIDRQRVFFVSSAPMAEDGLVNCSPKGMDSFAVLGPRRIGYADIGGSGIETVAHLKENGRITVMMCALDGPPKIFRFYGRGKVVEPHDNGFSTMLDNFPTQPTVRNIITVDIDRIIDSCGYGVPLYEFQQQRDSFEHYFANKSEDFVLNYRRERNATSLDGLTGLDIDKIPATTKAE